jgi:hypothetical protein
MKKIVIFSTILLILACKKDAFYELKRSLDKVPLPTPVIGNWRLLYSSGGFGGWIINADSTGKNILKIEANNTFKWCAKEVCSQGKWFYGSRQSSNPRYNDTLFIFETSSVESNFPLKIEQGKPRLIGNDTLVTFDDCNDCFNHVFVRLK